MRDPDRQLRIRKGQVGLAVSLVTLALSTLIFSMPIGDSDFNPLNYPIGWAGIFGSNIVILYFASALISQGGGSVWAQCARVVAVIELLLFIRFTCIPMSADWAGPWRTVRAVFYWMIPVVFCLGLLAVAFPARERA